MNTIGFQGFEAYYSSVCSLLCLIVSKVVINLEDTNFKIKTFIYAKTTYFKIIFVIVSDVMCYIITDYSIHLGLVSCC